MWEMEGFIVECGSYCVDNDTEDRMHTKMYGPLVLLLWKKAPTWGCGSSGWEVWGTRACTHATASLVLGPLHAGSLETSVSVHAHPTHIHCRKLTITIKRMFELLHARYPALSTQKVVNVQYLEWLDTNMLDDARC